MKLQEEYQKKYPRLRIWPKLAKDIQSYQNNYLPIWIWQCPICLKAHICYGANYMNYYCNGKLLIYGENLNNAMWWWENRGVYYIGETTNISHRPRKAVKYRLNKIG